jgi:ectoine hydroxylase-related dioxygenase (phytanoyl-CoA dioxygenase family)
MAVACPEGVLVESAVAAYHRDGYLVVRDLLTAREKRRLIAGVAEVERWPETPGRWMQYFEANRHSGARQLCRSENFIPYHAGLRRLLASPRVLTAVGDLLGEPALLYKDKINFKLPGANGFAPHQDAPAFTGQGQKNHLTLLFAVDACTPENGCLEMVVGGQSLGPLPHTEPGGGLAHSWVQRLEWTPVRLDAGDAVFFGSAIPHRSGPNATRAPRRSLYVTYNARSEGDQHAAYYADKRKHFPPECERLPEVDYAEGAKIYNLANPIR